MKLNRKGYMLVEIIIASVLAMGIAYYLLNLTYKFKNTSDDIYQSYLYTKEKILITKNIMSDFEKIDANVEKDNEVFRFKKNDTSLFFAVMKRDDINDIENTLYNSRGVELKNQVDNGIISVDEATNIFFLELEEKLLEEAECRKISINDGVIKYGKVKKNGDDFEYVIDDSSYYEKKISSGLIFGNIQLNTSLEAESIDYFSYTSDEPLDNILDSLSVTIPISSIYGDNDYSINLFLYLGKKANMPV